MSEYIHSMANKIIKSLSFAFLALDLTHGPRSVTVVWLYKNLPNG